MSFYEDTRRFFEEVRVGLDRIARLLEEPPHAPRDQIRVGTYVLRVYRHAGGTQWIAVTDADGRRDVLPEAEIESALRGVLTKRAGS
jgi:hypothetical protein